MSGFAARFPAIRELIRRPIVALSALTAVGLIAVLFLVAQSGFDRLNAANYRIALAQGRQAQLAQFLRLTVDLDGAQRDFLLTGEQSLLQPYQSALPRLDPLLDGLTNSYLRAHDTGGAESVRRIRELSRASLLGLESTLRIYRERGIDSARAMAAANATSQAQLLALVSTLLNEELLAVKDAASGWENDLSDTRALAVVGTVLNVLLMLIAALLMARELRRGAERVQVLDLAVRKQVDELAELSSHLQRVTEMEKAALARELHDELGGLLIASKMDAVWLQRRLPHAEPDIVLRLQRITQMIDAGVDFKRRVVENLRPTLLDNMGLLAALQWMLQETAQRSGIRCSAHFPDDEPVLGAEARIAVFRVVQEALANTVKHADARSVIVHVIAAPASLTVTIRDDGRGMPEGAPGRASHGLVNMRHRAQSLGGSYEMSSAPGAGTFVVVRIPLTAEDADRGLQQTSIPSG